MELLIRTTGVEDTGVPWKVAVCGFPGSGKTLLASTAADPLFVFFSDSPRYRSIVDRYIPHTKVTNKVDDADQLQLAAHEQLLELLSRIRKREVDLKTLVIDTGDELFQQMKEARRLQNGGEFNVGDWGWLADAYREVINGIIDLPVRVIVLFHVKTATEEEAGETHSFRELALQGAVKDEAPGWFDVVGALDTYKVVTDKGDETTKRVLLTHSSRLYPWVKDHSGSLPSRFQLSDDFVGDWENIEKHLNAKQATQASVQLHAFTITDENEIQSDTPIPSPEDLQAKKRENAVDGSQAEVLEVPGNETTKQEEPQVSDPELKTQPEDKSEPSPEETSDASPAVSSELSLEEAENLVKEELGAEEVEEEEVLTEPEKPSPSPEDPSMENREMDDDEAQEAEQEDGPEPKKALDECAECGVTVDEDMRELSHMRFRTVYCRDHFTEKRNKARSN